MAPVCEFNKEWLTTRGDLIKFTSDVKHLNAARKNFSFKRMVSPDQIDLIESLRKNYTKYASRYYPEKEIKVHRHRVLSFNLKSRNTIKSPTFTSGMYHKNSGVVVDFANKQLGGGFLTYGLAQEEVMFLERLDLCFYAAMMYAKNNPFFINDDEALVIHGADKWASLDYYGKVPDNWDLRSTFLPLGKPERSEAIIAIDCVRPTFKRYGRGDLQWILKKAYVGFQSVRNASISTGNWGCGAFGNNKNAILCIQTLAAALAGKELFYHADYDDCRDGMALIEKWMRRNMPIKMAFDDLVETCACHESFFTQWDPRKKSDGHFQEKAAGGRKSQVPVARRRTTRTESELARRKTVQKGEGLDDPFRRSTRVSDARATRNYAMPINLRVNTRADDRRNSGESRLSVEEGNDRGISNASPVSRGRVKSLLASLFNRTTAETSVPPTDLSISDSEDECEPSQYGYAPRPRKSRQTESSRVEGTLPRKSIRRSDGRSRPSQLEGGHDRARVTSRTRRQSVRPMHAR